MKKLKRMFSRPFVVDSYRHVDHDCVIAMDIGLKNKVAGVVQTHIALVQTAKRKFYILEVTNFLECDSEKVLFEVEWKLSQCKGKVLAKAYPEYSSLISQWINDDYEDE